MSRCEH